LKTEGLEEWLCLPSKCKALVQTPVPPPAKRKKKKARKKVKKRQPTGSEIFVSFS
jgi:hypothetical protein